MASVLIQLSQVGRKKTSWVVTAQHVEAGKQEAQCLGSAVYRVKIGFLRG